MKIARHRGRKKAIVALTRGLAVIMHTSLSRRIYFCFRRLRSLGRCLLHHIGLCRSGAEEHLAQRARASGNADSPSLASSDPCGTTVLDVSNSLVLRLLGVKTQSEEKVTQEEIRRVLSEGLRAGALLSFQRSMMERVIPKQS
jgi:hypothetical protein